MIDGGSYDPQDYRLLTLDWTAELGQISLSVGQTVTIVTSTWAVSPAGPTINGRPNTISTNGKKTSFWVTGGTLGVVYSFTNHVTLSDSPASERDETLQMLCESH